MASRAAAILSTTPLWRSRGVRWASRRAAAAATGAQESYYNVLGVGTSASADDIKKAFKAKAMELHPDVNPEDSGAAAKFAAVNEAYATLGDGAARRKYDAKRAAGGGGRGRGVRYPQQGGGDAGGLRMRRGAHPDASRHPNGMSKRGAGSERAETRRRDWEATGAAADGSAHGGRIRFTMADVETLKQARRESGRARANTHAYSGMGTPSPGAGGASSASASAHARPGTLQLNERIKFDPDTRTWTVKNIARDAAVSLDFAIDDDRVSDDYFARAVHVVMRDCARVRVVYGTHASATLVRCEDIVLSPREIMGAESPSANTLYEFYESVEEVNCGGDRACEYKAPDTGGAEAAPGVDVIRRYATRRSGAWTVSDAPLPEAPKKGSTGGTVEDPDARFKRSMAAAASRRGGGGIAALLDFMTRLCAGMTALWFAVFIYNRATGAHLPQVPQNEGRSAGVPQQPPSAGAR